MRNTAMVSPPFGGQKSVDFRGKRSLYVARTLWRGKPMGSDLSADCGRKNMGFSTPFGTVVNWQQGIPYANP